MKAIDATVHLPHKAYPLRKYARFYALRPDGKIAALFYANTKSKRPAGRFCSSDGPEGKLQSIPCPADDRPEANEQRWVNYNELPLIFDGGCGVIDIIYNPQSAEIEETACHGMA
ncbi:hypothetical protein QH494_02875 [Sphingomonas sp. AR_OL41]|uniref:hypothetical protein n=1 Tax=Sphingomonas sp. AR_OL41 TaxID=3042729 RepID=UPI002481448C|nr:hypothetical protein [Sphingomonas sp. AR_OL41]MDH7971113.1 hypothetical protein [Sphingomonas sp. AR_OL41]